MKILIGIIFMLIGLIPLVDWLIKEDSKTYFKIMGGATCGVLVLGGLVIILFL